MEIYCVSWWCDYWRYTWFASKENAEAFLARDDVGNGAVLSNPMHVEPTEKGILEMLNKYFNE